MDKDVVYIHKGILAIKKNEILLCGTTWIDIEAIMPSEVKWEKNIVLFYLSVGSKNKTNEQT